MNTPLSLSLSLSAHQVLQLLLLGSEDQVGRQTSTMDVSFSYPLAVLQVHFRVVGIHLEDFRVDDWGFRRGSELLASMLLPIRS